MDIRVLRNFLAVAREGNITRAAESLHITQPSLSKQLMDLEKELGKQLFIRGKRKITLTEDGALLRKRADEIVALMEKTKQEISLDTAEVSGEISIGGTPTKKVLQVAAALRKKHPGIQFHFFSSDATDVVERLDHGSLDFAILLEPIDTTKYEYISLPDFDCWGLLMPNDCDLAKKNVIQREDLCSVPLIFHRRIGLQREIALWAQTEVEHMDIAATYNVINGNPSQFVKSGLGYFLTSQYLAAVGIDPDVCFRPLFPQLELHYAFVWKRYPIFNKASKTFLNELKNILS